MRIAAGIGGLRASAWRLGLGLLAAAGGGRAAAALPPEFPSFHLAVVEQDARTARAFIAAFPDSPLIADLIVMLPPATAQEVCAGLSADGAPAVAAACQRAALLVATGGMDGNRLDPDRGLGIDRRSASNGGDGAAGGRFGAGARGEVVAAAAANTTARALTLVVALTAAPGSAAPAKDSSAARADPAAADSAGKAQSDPASVGPRLGGDPGSDPGVAAAPSRHDSDAGGDGDGSGGNGAKDSHH